MLLSWRRNSGFDSHNHDHLKVTLKSLVDCTVEWNVLGKNNKEVWGAASLLAEVNIEDGLCFYQFSHTLRQKLHNPLMYTKLNLRLQNRFKSQYALILWEVCFDYFDIHWGRGETPFIPLERFRELIGVESDEYQTFKALNQKIIKPAIIEINNLTDYFVEVEQKRFKRKGCRTEIQHCQSQETSSQGVGIPGCRGPTACRCRTCWSRC